MGGGRIALALGAFCLIAVLPLVTRAQNSSGLTEVEGGDFETPVYSSAPFYAFAPAGDARWTWSGAAGVQRNGSGLGADAPKGVQTAFLRSANGAPSRFSAPITLDAGAYRVRFKAAQRFNSGGVPIQIKLDNTSVGAPIVPTNTAFEVYKSEPFQVSAAGSTYRLEFGTDSVGGNAMSLIDAILIEAVPTATLNSGGFETPVFAQSPFYGQRPVNSGWDWSERAGIQRNGSGLGADAPEGVQTAFLQGGGAAASAFAQNISFNAGDYQVKFKAARRATGDAVPIQVSIDGNALGAPILPASGGAFGVYVTPQFTVAEGVHQLRFSTSHPSGSFTSLIDDVKLNVKSIPVLPAPLAPFVPEAASVTTTPGRADVSWQPAFGATGYRVKRGTVAGGPYVTLPATVNGTLLVDTPISNGVTYYYRVFAFNNAGAGGDSREVSATPMAAPVVTATGGNNRNVLSWNPVAGATSYTVAATATYGGADRAPLPVAGTMATDTSLDASTAYFYRVTALNATGSSTTFVRAVTLPGKPLIVTAVPNFGAGSIDLEWRNARGDVPDVYKIKRATVAGGPYTTLAADINGIRYTDTGLARATYYYRVYAFNESGNGPESDEVGMTLIAPPAAPTLAANVTGSNANGTVVNLSWTASPEATSYRLDRYDSNNQLRRFDNLPGLTLADSSAIYGQTYRYRVYASNEGGTGNASNEVTVTVVAPPAAPTLTATPGNATVVLSWNGVSGATHYRLKRGVAAGGPYTALPNVISGTTFSDSGLTNGTTYYYRVTAVNAGGNGADSNEASAKPTAPPVAPPAAPTNIAATPGDASVSLSWSAVSGAASYKVKRGTTAGGPYATLAPVISSTNFTDGGLSNGTTYYYRVYAVNSAGNGADSAEVQATPLTVPVAPANLVAAAGNAQITLSWSAVNGAATYKIKRSTTNGGPYTTLAPSVTANAYTDSGLNNGTPYYYRVYAVNASGNGPDSDQAQATPVVPQPPTAPTNFVAVAGTSRVSLSWTASNEATSYQVLRRLQNGNYITPIATANATTYVDTTAVNGTLYFYVVRAVGATGTSSNSNEQSAMPFAQSYDVLNLISGDVLSDEFSLDVNIFDLNLIKGGLNLSVDGSIIAVSSLDAASNVSPFRQNWIIPTKLFGNGQHTIKVSSKTEDKTFSVSFQNSIFNVRFNPVFSPDGDGSGSPTTFNVTATFDATKSWKVDFKDYDDNIVRSFSGSGRSLQVSWDGNGTGGAELRSGTYFMTISISDFAALQRGSVKAASFSKRNKPKILLVDVAPPEFADVTVIKDHQTDSAIIIDAAAVQGGLAGAKQYAKFVEATVAKKYGQSLNNWPRAIVTNGVSMMMSDGATPIGVYNSAISRWVDWKLTSWPLKLFYVCSHGGTTFTISGVNVFGREIPYFGIGPHIWMSEAPPAGALPVTTHVVPNLVAHWRYGQAPGNEPPHLVWIDACETSGNPNATSSSNLAFARAFGIDSNAIDSAYECFYLGWRGPAQYWGSSLSWTMWRNTIWNEVFAGNQNMVTAIARADSRFPSFPNGPQDARDGWGEPQTHF